MGSVLLVTSVPSMGGVGVGGWGRGEMLYFFLMFFKQPIEA